MGEGKTTVTSNIIINQKIKIYMDLFPSKVVETTSGNIIVEGFVFLLSNRPSDCLCSFLLNPISSLLMALTMELFTTHGEGANGSNGVCVCVCVCEQVPL
ncbi:hypothetical protein AMECASPLE_024862 [Ameca splendens]|uniref:Uncharacterized protein n=1 Tax=Ameca splendens TaxID=208324 RepID=A0ABV0Z327_9TELE